MERATVVLDVKADGGMKSLRQMKQELRDLQIAMSKASDPTEFKRLEAEFAKLRNDMKDTSAAMQYMDPGELLGGWIKMTQGVVGSFAAISGAMSLFGDDSEEIQKIEKKSMTLIQTMMGLEQMRQLLIDEGGKAQIKSLLQNTAAQYKEITAMITKNLVITTTTKTSKAAAAAQWLWNAAVTAFPLVALVAGVAALSYGIYKLIDAQKEQISVLNVSQDLQKKQGENAASELVQLDAMVKKLKDAKDNKKEYSAVVKQWNEKYGKEYNASLSTTVFNLDAITSAANKAREAILKKALAAAAEEKLKEIVSDNIVMYETYITATESLGLKKAALAKEEELYNYFIKEGMIDAAVAQREYINTLKDKIAVGYEAYGLDEDYVKEIEVLTQVVADNTVITQSQTTATKDYGTAVKDTTKDLEKLQKLLAEGVDEQEALDLYLSEEAKKALADKRLAEKEQARLQQEAFEAELMLIQSTAEKEQKIKDGWYAEEILKREEHFDKRLKLLKEFHDKGLITEKDYQRTVALLIQEQVDKYADYISTITDNLSSVFSNLTEMAMIEIEKQDYAWQQSYEERSEALNTHLEDVKRIFGEESQRYKDLLEEQKKMDEEKAEHDKKITAEKKAAEQKYAKFQIGAQMAEATATFAQGVAGIWAQALATQGPFGAITATALTALLTATYGTQMALMIKQLGAVGKMKQGGLITGPSHEAGGVLKELEGGEFVINARAMSVPGMRSLASQMNSIGSRNETSPIKIDTNGIAEAVTGAIKSIPVTVLESDITKTQQRVKLIQTKNTL